MQDILIRHLGLTDYLTTWQAMQQFTDQREAHTPDEIWLLQHRPVFTLGQAGQENLLHHASDIPLVRSDRGGQITYHGPGQWVAYLLIDLRRRGYGVRELVGRMEQTVIDLLHEYGLAATRRDHAPGVYVDDAKIASLGLRIRRGCSYHGLALNVDMDLTPFSFIHPCGYQHLRVTQLHDLAAGATMPHSATRLLDLLTQQLNVEQEPRG